VLWKGKRSVDPSLVVVGGPLICLVTDFIILQEKFDTRNPPLAVKNKGVLLAVFFLVG
jgi:hypothetical protein